jgi:hypothetical protein
MKIRYRVAAVAAVALMVSLGLATSAMASTNTQWKLGSYTANGGFSFKEAKSGNFSFPMVPAQCSPSPGCEGNTGQGPALDLTNKGTLVGDQLGKTITAKFTIADPGNAFAYGGEPDGSGGVANMRLYFDSASIVGTQVNTNYWWSDTAIQAMTDGTFTLTAVIDPTTSWGDLNGQPSSSNTAAFDAAASNIKDIGLSFGGGYFAANGVGTTDGMGTFTLTSLTVN